MSDKIRCKICCGHTEKFSEKKVLNKYDVKYYKCADCNFIQTEDPYWLNEAYNNAITKLDVGLVYRNEYLVPIVSTIINVFYKDKATYLDYGGGYGLFVRMMRDRGFDFYRQDIYCENLFAKHFDLSDLPVGSHFEMVTAFEVFEHLEDPYGELQKMLCHSDTILFSTELQPEIESELQNWWYFTPETGQHISLYHLKSLQIMAEKSGMHLLSYKNLHMFSRKKRKETLYKLAFRTSYQKLSVIMNKRSSLLSQDFNKVKSIIS
jgi:2-polyprenyl-3-methyl-5-hydroxy-6-metoxy-1,4-benzoquinol methylase